MMQHALSLLQSGDPAGAEQVLQSVKDVKSAQTYYNWQAVTLGEKHKFQVRIPKTYRVKREKEINLWRASHDEITYMRDQFKKKQCCFNHEAKWFIVASIVASPKLSGAAVEVLMRRKIRSQSLEY
jgi:hypothetical protein